MRASCPSRELPPEEPVRPERLAPRWLGHHDHGPLVLAGSDYGVGAQRDRAIHDDSVAEVHDRGAISSRRLRKTDQAG